MEKEKIRILYISPEAVPFSGTGGLGDVAGSLPQALNRKRDIDCRVITPLHKKITREYRDKMEFLGSKYIPVAWRSKYMGVFRMKAFGVTWYSIDNEEYFGRDALYGHMDDCERYTFFSRSVFESMDLTGFYPNILHANDWQTAMVPVYQDSVYKLDKVTTIYTIHNIEYQGMYGYELMDDVLGLPAESAHIAEYNGLVNMMKCASEAANIVSTVSPTYARQLEDPFFAHGLDPIIRKNSFKMRGILNGIDVKTWDPAKDPYIAENYSAEDPSGKSSCKADLQEAIGLPLKNVPLVTAVTRLVAHKGLDLVTATIEGVLNRYDIQLVVLGTGDSSFENYFRGLEERYPDKVRSMIMFDRALSHKIYAGGDILLMPSKSEPCGLSQMIGCRYGDVPLVRATGGLADSIVDCTLGDGNGFVFEGYDAGSFYSALCGAIERYYDRENWNKLVAHDLTLDWSWSSASREYADMYREVIFK